MWSVLRLLKYVNKVCLDLSNTPLASLCDNSKKGFQKRVKTPVTCLNYISHDALLPINKATSHPLNADAVFASCHFISV